MKGDSEILDGKKHALSGRHRTQTTPLPSEQRTHAHLQFQKPESRASSTSTTHLYTTLVYQRLVLPHETVALRVDMRTTRKVPASGRSSPSTRSVIFCPEFCCLKMPLASVRCNLCSSFAFLLPSGVRRGCGSVGVGGQDAPRLCGKSLP